MQNKCQMPHDLPEYVVCPTCKNKISELTSIRCPRCFSPLLTMGCKGNCSKCGKNHSTK